MDQRRSLLVLRHAQTEEARPGRPDKERRLTPDGQRQATEAGDHLRTLGITVDTVLCSSAARARQTLELLKLDEQRASGQVDVADRFYNAGTDTLIHSLRELPDDRQVALLIGHAPGAPGVVYELTDRSTSVPEAVAAIEGRFPAAALAQLEFDGDWSQLDSCSLTRVWMPGVAGA
ncbi:MAG TPA: histidine phosphatase family protein [Propionibacteriaceae bacterium]|nr:histidine phosphatase family protein [Propionibacteriaceae bacterium]